MYEYCVRSWMTTEPKDLNEYINAMANVGWRLTSTLQPPAQRGPFALFIFERIKP